MRILLVEDHEDFREIFTRILELELAPELDVTFAQADSLAGAHALLREEDGLDAAMIDIGLADGDGLDLVHELEPYGRNSTSCPQCGRFDGVLLETLQEIIALPDAVGAHACECGHPEMRCLPDGVYRCPACGLEVLPI